ncbi:MAG: type II secretion system F family protein [Candidatus Omnitrophota bacterium]
MPKFSYTARDVSGKKVVGFEEASSQDELINRLQIKKLIVLNVALESEEGAAAFKFEGQVTTKLRFKHNAIRGEDLVVFCRQLATLLGAAVTILRSLDTISQQVASRKLHFLIRDLMKSMEAGLSFHESLAKHPKYFSDLWINLVETGEASGNLAGVLNRLASYLERDAAFRNKIISSLIYPMILLIAATGALLFLTIKIIPTFADLFKGFNVDLPPLTLILLQVSNFIKAYLLLITGLLIAAFFALRAYVKTKDGRLLFEQIKFSIPVFGEFYRALIVERFSSGMSTLIESGVPILYSLEITEHSVNNSIMAGILHRVKDDVREGKSLSQTLEKSGFFEPMVIQMIAVGEEVGDLPQMFKRINTFYQEYTETFLVRFTAMFEPIMLIFMGLVIGIMVVGMFMPIFQIATISGG